MAISIPKITLEGSPFRRLLGEKLARVIELLPDSLARPIVHCGLSISRHNTTQLLKIIKTEKLASLGVKNVEEFRLIGLAEIEDYKLRDIQPARQEKVYFPRVYGISDGGEVAFLSRDISLYMFPNAVMHPLSDFIRIGSTAYWDKLGRFQLRKTIPFDKDFVTADLTRNRCFLSNVENVETYEIAFSLLGVHAAQWGHFLPTFLPKLRALQYLSGKQGIKILLPDSIDSHMLESVRLATSAFPSFQIQTVKRDSFVKCKKLYYCTSPAFFVDHAESLHMGDFQISSWSLNAMQSFAKEATAKFGRCTPPRKLFLSRRGIRNCVGLEEMEEQFKMAGFEVIQAHQMTFKEKVEAFYNASHVAGVASSGFANCIFSKPATKVLMFTGYSRSMDGYLSTIANSSFELDLTLLVGTDYSSVGIHPGFAIPIDEVRACGRSLGFFDRSM
jgi:hypothetical protein